jgi:peptidoglycan/LPS O-acetylase OafA/YrhL
MCGHVRHQLIAPFNLELSWVTTLGFLGGYSLLFFYVISGFLISTALAEKYSPTPAGTGAFYRSRFVRIFSLYWPVASLCLLLVPDSWGHFLDAPLHHKAADIVLLGTDWNVLFAMIWPQPTWTATIGGIEPAWSLGAELGFYVIAPFLLRRWRWAVAVLLTSVAVRVAVYQGFGPGSLWNYCFAPSTLVFFMLGHFARLAAERCPQLAYRSTASILIAAWIGLTALRPEVPWDGTRFWLTYVAFAAALPGLFAWTKSNRILNAAGELSYPVYLVHPILVVFARRWTLPNVVSIYVPTDIAGYVVVAIITAIVLIAAIVAHIVCERWFGALLRRLSAPRTSTAPRRGIEPVSLNAPG